jgi:Spy/CpxP family protein refolding chaperone
MKRTLITLALVGTFGLAPIAAFAHEGGHGDDHGPGMKRVFKHKMGMEHLTKDLNLTPDQQAKVQPIVDQAKPQIRAIHEEAMQKTRSVMESTAAQIRPLLTPEQQTKFDAMKEAHLEMMQARKKMREARRQ